MLVLKSSKGICNRFAQVTYPYTYQPIKCIFALPTLILIYISLILSHQCLMNILAKAYIILLISRWLFQISLSQNLFSNFCSLNQNQYFPSFLAHILLYSWYCIIIILLHCLLQPLTVFYIPVILDLEFAPQATLNTLRVSDNTL